MKNIIVPLPCRLLQCSAGQSNLLHHPVHPPDQSLVILYELVDVLARVGAAATGTVELVQAGHTGQVVDYVLLSILSIEGED